MSGETFVVATSRALERRDVTAEVQKAVGSMGVKNGFVVVSVPHTTAAVTVGENWDPDVGTDIERALAEWVPMVRFDHGEGNSSAHFLSEAIGHSRMVKVEKGKLRLGRWQGVFLLELDGPRERHVLVDSLGTAETLPR